MKNMMPKGQLGRQRRHSSCLCEKGNSRTRNIVTSSPESRTQTALQLLSVNRIELFHLNSFFRRQDSSPYRKEALLRSAEDTHVTLTIVNSMIPYNGPYTSKMLKTLAIDNSMIPYNGPYTSKMLKTLAIDNSMIPYNGPYTSKMLKCDKNVSHR
ncbi:Endogenous retrovirus group K member 5 Gag polyprotein [Trichinella spiralis]|uniref:Endogenous retrovirus group K member 5 Gag polyprotein n=1 Tax=Trichinella spiralis TaxID=6334 RepID=A0ABR3K5Q1_TRISP